MTHRNETLEASCTQKGDSINSHEKKNIILDPTFDDLTSEKIKQHVNDLKDQSFESSGLFTVKSANKWIKEANERPIPKMLFDKFWYEGELCILFADTNLGKSILAVQIANSISKGLAIDGFELEANTQTVLYFDFELSGKQFENRYSIEYQNHYIFDDRFLRSEINIESIIPEIKSLEDFIYESLEQCIQKTKAKTIILDNITYLKNGTEKAKDALPLMKQLKALKNKYNLSILALAHTPKRDLSKPITRNDLQGSKMLINFCDSAFAIGESQIDTNIRYLKQIKARNTEIIYDNTYVCLCHINKIKNFLQFNWIGYSSEIEHLKQITEKDTKEIEENVLKLGDEGMSLRVIGKELGISHMRVKRILNRCNKT